MKKILFLLFVSSFAFSSFAQKDFPYKFKEIVNNDATKTKDQCNTGTCWSFSTVSFVESELLRMGKGVHNLSEMFNVRITYPKKAENYVRYQGKAQFGPGSLSHDVIRAIAEGGMVPEEVYSGLHYGLERHDHSEMDAMLLGMVESLVNKRRGNLTGKWMDAIEAVLNTYLGEIPENFTYKGKSYTPQGFRDAMGFVPDDYVSLSSFNHHPFYESFILEVPDNFSQGSFYNVTIDELLNTVKYAVENGYTVAWDADVSEKGFSFRNGMAIVPAAGVTKDQMFTEMVDEMEVDQAIRQAGFDNQSTTDDHLMHITGLAKDQDGKEYFITKNSWGTGNAFDGYQYVSMAYFKLKTISILLHKDGVEKGVAQKLGL